MPRMAITVVSRLKKRVYEIVEVAAPGDRLSRAFDIFILTLVALNIVALAVETVRPMYEAAPRGVAAIAPHEKFQTTYVTASVSK